MIWIELSSGFLPRADDASEFTNSTLSKISTLEPGTQFIAPAEADARPPLVNEDQLPLGVTTYTEWDMTCTFPEKPTEYQRSTDSRTSSTSSSPCKASGLAVAFPTCKPPVSGAPGAEKWLGAKQTGRDAHPNVISKGSVNGAFFIANMLPTLIASLFSLPWKLMQLHALSLEPFHQLSKPAGTSLSASVFGKYSGFSVIKAPIPFLTTCLVLLSSCVTVLSSIGWSLGLAGVNGVCEGKDNAGCAPYIQVSREVVHAITATLALMIVLAVALAIWSRFWSIRVLADPRSIVGVASLFQSRGLRSVFGLLDPKSTFEEMKTRAGRTEVRLNTDSVIPAVAEYGIILAEQSQILQPKIELTSNTVALTSQGHKHFQQERMSVGRIGYLLGLLGLFLFSLTALIVYYVMVTDREDRFEDFMSGQTFGPHAMFAACGIIINYGWVETFTLLLPLAPYYALSSDSDTTPNADTTILPPYSSDPFSSLVRSIRSCNIPIASVALPAILSEFLPLLLANVPFDRTTTGDAHKVSSWLAVAVMTPMIITALALLVFLVKKRPRHRVNVELLRKAPLAATLLLLHRSEELLRLAAEVENCGSGERDEEIRARGLRYGIVSRGKSGGPNGYYSSVCVRGRDALEGAGLGGS
ncbi:het-s domain protein [Stemphylium lycopersici]|nr:het-s domain protein [Stemphylium lycopersici]